MRAFILPVFFAFCAYTNLQAQKIDPLDDLRFYADVIANAGNPIHKERAHAEFADLFDKWLRSDQYNKADLESINWLSVKYPADESFTIITWQLQLDDSDNRYYGYIVKDKKVTVLKNTEELTDLEYEVVGPEEWIGALYYNILPVQKGGKDYYILFGYDAHKNYELRKIAEVLYFENDKPVFGAEMFQRKEKDERGIIKNRLILDYANDANVSLNFNPGLDMIVFDHLIPRMGRVPGQGATMLPDGSYVGYKWDGSYFNYVDKLYHQTQETAPFPKPILGENSKSKNIFGSQKQVKTKKKRRN